MVNTNKIKSENIREHKYVNMNKIQKEIIKGKTKIHK